MPPRVNVMINTYNHAQFLRQAVESVLSQDGVSFDVTIIDDVSTDGTEKIIEEFAAAYPGLVRVSCPPVNLYSSAELRRVINRAEGEFVALMDGDDYWTDPEKLHKQVAFLDENPALSMCFHDCVVVDRSGEPIRDSFFGTGRAPAIGSCRDIARANYVPGPSPLIRRSALAPLPDWIDPCDWTDWALHLIAAQHGPIGFIPERMGAYRIHPLGHWNGMTAEERFDATRRFLDYLGAHLPAARTRELDRGIACYWTDMFVSQIGAGRARAAARSIADLLEIARGGRRIALLRKVAREIAVRCTAPLR